MNLLPTLQWDCVEFHGKESYRTLLVGEPLTKYSIGETVTAAGKIATYLASSKLGITMFDLFGEILQRHDLEQFLTANKVRVLATMFENMIDIRRDAKRVISKFIYRGVGLIRTFFWEKPLTYLF